MVIISIGMPRSGTLWRYNLVRDLVVADGGVDGLEIRRKYLLHLFLGPNNADINTLKAKRLIPAMLPALLGNKYVINTHSGPQPLVKELMRKGKIKAIYGYRDPRACILSMLEYSQRAKPNYSATFLALKDVNDAVNFMDEYMKIWEEWIEVGEALKVRYEDMLDDYQTVTDQIITYLGIDRSNPKVDEIVNTYLPGKRKEGGPRMHLQKGIAERFREAFPQEDQEFLVEVFAPYLAKMGYEA